MMDRAEVAPHCPICGAAGGWRMPFRDVESGAVLCRTTGYHWRVCPSCGSGYPSASPGLEELQRYWDINRVEDLPAEPVDVWESRLQSSRYWAERTWEFVAPHLARSKGRFLDIACGLGATVKKFQDQGWEATGIDADPNTRSIHRQLGVEAVIGQFEGVKTAGKFDLISIAHAVYFISQPREFFHRVRESLNDDGLFLVLVSRFASSLSDGYPCQVHTWYPTSSSLSHALALSGFETVATRKHKGSIFVLARVTARAVPLQGAAWRSAVALRTHALRYRLYGRTILWLGRRIKHLMGVGTA